VLGVQWHPEADPASRVIETFVAEAARAASLNLKTLGTRAPA
jgi:gamma-glutamyl-gamma-aminobutyrate hydrolase PuuD